MSSGSNNRTAGHQSRHPRPPSCRPPSQSRTVRSAARTWRPTLPRCAARRRLPHLPCEPTLVIRLELSHGPGTFRHRRPTPKAQERSRGFQPRRPLRFALTGRLFGLLASGCRQYPVGGCRFGGGRRLSKAPSSLSLLRCVGHAGIIHQERTQLTLDCEQVSRRVAGQGRFPLHILGRIVHAGDGWLGCLLCEACADQRQRRYSDCDSIRCCGAVVIWCARVCCACRLAREVTGSRQGSAAAPRWASCGSRSGFVISPDSFLPALPPILDQKDTRSVVSSLVRAVHRHALNLCAEVTLKHHVVRFLSSSINSGNQA